MLTELDLNELGEQLKAQDNPEIWMHALAHLHELWTTANEMLLHAKPEPSPFSVGAALMALDADGKPIIVGAANRRRRWGAETTHAEVRALALMDNESQKINDSLPIAAALSVARTSAPLAPCGACLYVLTGAMEEDALIVAANHTGQALMASRGEWFPPIIPTRTSRRSVDQLDATMEMLPRQVIDAAISQMRRSRSVHGQPLISCGVALYSTKQKIYPGCEVGVSTGHPISALANASGHLLAAGEEKEQVAAAVFRIRSDVPHITGNDRQMLLDHARAKGSDYPVIIIYGKETEQALITSASRLLPFGWWSYFHGIDQGPPPRFHLRAELIQQIIGSSIPLHFGPEYDRISSAADYGSEGDQLPEVFYDDRNTRILIMAPHGGKIELLSDRLADKISEKIFSCYRFIGDIDQHLASTRFDEPTALAAVEKAAKVVTIHVSRNTFEFNIMIGGRDTQLSQAIGEALRQAGFEIATPPPFLAGVSPQNITNRGTTGSGVQIEISDALRQYMELAPEVMEIFTTVIHKVLVEEEQRLCQISLN